MPHSERVEPNERPDNSRFERLQAQSLSVHSSVRREALRELITLNHPNVAPHLVKTAASTPTGFPPKTLAVFRKDFVDTLLFIAKRHSHPLQCPLRDALKAEGEFFDISRLNPLVLVLATIGTADAFKVLTEHFSQLNGESIDEALTLIKTTAPNIHAAPFLAVVARDGRNTRRSERAFNILMHYEHPATLEALAMLAGGTNSRHEALWNAFDHNPHPEVLGAHIVAAQAALQSSLPGQAKTARHNLHLRQALERYKDFRLNPQYQQDAHVVAFGHVRPFVRRNAQKWENPKIILAALDGVKGTPGHSQAARALRMVFGAFDRNEGHITENPQVITHAVRAALTPASARGILRGNVKVYLTQLRDRLNRNQLK